MRRPNAFTGLELMCQICWPTMNSRLIVGRLASSVLDLENKCRIQRDIKTGTLSDFFEVSPHFKKEFLIEGLFYVSCDRCIGINPPL